MESSLSPHKSRQAPVEQEGLRKRERDGNFAAVTEPGQSAMAAEAADVQVEQLQRRHVSEQQQLQLEQLEQLKTFKEQLLRDLFTQLSPRPTAQHHHGAPLPPAVSAPLAPSLPHMPELLLASLSPTPRSTLSASVPATTPSSEHAVCVSPVSTHIHLPSPPPVSGHTPDKTSTRPSPRSSPAQPLLPASPHTLPPSSEASAAMSPPSQPSLPHSPTPHTSHHTPLSWSGADSFETLAPSPSLQERQKSPQQFHLSNQNLCRQQPNSSPQDNTHFPHHTERPVPPVPRPAWVDKGDTPRGQNSDTRAALIEKHTRHMEDLKSYYKSQMAKVQVASQHSLPANQADGFMPMQASNIPSSKHVFSPVRVDTAGARRSLDLSTPLSPVLTTVSHSEQQRTFARLMAENDRLKTNCTDLESRVNRALEKQLEAQKEYWLELQTQAETYSHTIGVLQDKLGACRTQLKQQDSMVEQLQADLQMSLGEIQFWKEQQAQESSKFKQLYVEFEEVQRKKETLEASQESLRDELMTARRELGRMEAAAKASASQEQGLKSTIQKLEDRIRHLEHINNRLHGQATHYSLGSSYPNSPDDDKLWRRPHSATHTPSSSSSSHPPQCSTSPISSTPPPPRRNPATSTPPHTPPSTHHHHTQTSGHSRSSPLNRRKWLEPSDPGLILGAPPPSLPHSPPRYRGGHSDITSSPLLQSTGQAIARQHSDSGSSNEGEDPTSLTKQSYINSSNKKGGPLYGDGESSLVASTLSAIHSGKIRTDAAKGGKARKEVEKESVEERVKHSLRVVAEAEERLVELRREKENLESMLQRTPRHGGRVTRHSKQTQLEMEERLEVVLKEIGSVKMTLRSHHAFHK